MPENMAVEVSGLTKEYSTATGPLRVLEDIDLQVASGEILAVTGRSGAGKSTLLHILGGLDRPTSGQVRVGGIDMSTLPEKALAEFRNSQIGFVFQFHHLLPEFSALENVAMPRLIAGNDRKESEEEAAELLERVGLSERLNHLPGELSGGEQQRVAVARALVNSPAVILADEPSGNLDDKTSQELHNVLWDLARTMKRTVIIVTHDLALASEADRQVVLESRHVLQTQP